MRHIQLAVTLALLLGCGKPLNEYPADLVDNFLAACRSRGGSEVACECALDAIRRRFTAEEYGALEARVARKDEEAGAVLAEVVTECQGR